MLSLGTELGNGLENLARRDSWDFPWNTSSLRPNGCSPVPDCRVLNVYKFLRYSNKPISMQSGGDGPAAARHFRSPGAGYGRKSVSVEQRRLGMLEMWGGKFSVPFSLKAAYPIDLAPQLVRITDHVKTPVDLRCRKFVHQSTI